MQGRSASGLAVMTDTTKGLNIQIQTVEGLTYEAIFTNVARLDAMKADVAQTKKVLLASNRYLTVDYSTALEQLRVAIDRYAKALIAKLKDDQKNVTYTRETSQATVVFSLIASFREEMCPTKHLG